MPGNAGKGLDGITRNALVIRQKQAANGIIVRVADHQAIVLALSQSSPLGRLNCIGAGQGGRIVGADDWYVPAMTCATTPLLIMQIS